MDDNTNVQRKGVGEPRDEALEYKNSTDPNLVEFAKDVLKGDKKNATQKQYTIGEVNNRAVADIAKLTGIDVSNFKHAIDGGHIGHIELRHGSQGKADQSMKNLEDIGRVKYVLDNYDNIQLLNEVNRSYKNADGTQAKMIQYTKRVNGNYYVVEAVPDTKNDKLWIVSIYKSNARSDNKVVETEHDNNNYPAVNVQNASTTNNIEKV